MGKYAVKEIFLTLQGEGAHTGRAAVFCRFAGCNLWSGREEDRGDAMCGFCETDFVGLDCPGCGPFPDAGGFVRAFLFAFLATADGRRQPCCEYGRRHRLLSRSPALAA